MLCIHSWKIKLTEDNGEKQLSHGIINKEEKEPWMIHTDGVG